MRHCQITQTQQYLRRRRNKEENLETYHCYTHLNMMVSSLGNHWYYSICTLSRGHVVGGGGGGYGPPTPGGSTPPTRPIFFPPYPFFSLFLFFLGTPAQNSDFLPPHIWPPPIFHQTPPYPRPFNPRAPIPLSSLPHVSEWIPRFGDHGDQTAQHTLYLTTHMESNNFFGQRRISFERIQRRTFK